MQAIDTNRDYWSEYYAVRKRIEAGEGREHPELYVQLDRLRFYAEARRDYVHSWVSRLTEQNG